MTVKSVSFGKPDPEAHPVDVHVGERIRRRRVFLGMTQDELAKAIGLTFQQVQKYERGFNRVSASRLVAIARTLQVPVSTFFDGLPEDVAPPTEIGGPAPDEDAVELALMLRRVPGEQRAAVVDLVRSMGRG